MKKLLFFGAALLVLLLATLSLFNSNNVVNALTINLFTVEEGDLIKVDGDSAVYRVGSDLKKHLFVNGVTFWTHYNGDWSNIKDNGTAIVIKSISQEDFDSMESGDHITARPGRKLIRFQNSLRVYVVYSNNKIKQVDTNNAQFVYGDDWASQVIIIQNGFETDYERNNNDFVDSDNDGISDIDENNIYGTDPNNPDSDGDGYRDGAEIVSGYNPNGSGKMEYLIKNTCVVNWSCSSWTECYEGNQTRTCLSSCGDTSKLESQTCSISMNGWKIYQGDKTGIEFKYPDDYIIRIQNHGWFFPVLESAHVITDDDKYIFEDDFLLSDVDDFISSDLVIGLDINRDGLVGFRSDVEKEFSEILSALTPTEGSSISEIKDITIDGKSGFEYEFKNVILNDDLGMFDISVMLVVDGDIRYRIFYFIFDDYSGDKTERINLYKDIISTLKLDAELARYDDIAFPLRDQAFDAQIKSELSQFRTYMAITY